MKELKAINDSIDKWTEKKNWSSVEVKYHEDLNHNGRCPLCVEFKISSYHPCSLCPIYKETGVHFCERTPFTTAIEKFKKFVYTRSIKSFCAWQSAAQKEIDFLKSLAAKYE